MSKPPTEDESLMALEIDRLRKFLERIASVLEDCDLPNAALVVRNGIRPSS